MAQQALQGAQDRLDQLQKQYDEAYRAYEVEPTSDVKKERYQKLDILLNKAQVAVTSLAAAAAGAVSATGGQDLMCPIVANSFAYRCPGQIFTQALSLTYYFAVSEHSQCRLSALSVDLRVCH